MKSVMGSGFELVAFTVTLTLDTSPASGRLNKKTTLRPFFSNAVNSGIQEESARQMNT